MRKLKCDRFEDRCAALREVHGANWRSVCFLDMGGDAPPPPDLLPFAEAFESGEFYASGCGGQSSEARRTASQALRDLLTGDAAGFDVAGQPSIVEEIRADARADVACAFDRLTARHHASVDKVDTSTRSDSGITLIGFDPRTGLSLYRYHFTDDPSRKFIGVVVDDVLRHAPWAVGMDERGLVFVDYQMLGMEFQEVQ